MVKQNLFAETPQQHNQNHFDSRLALEQFCHAAVFDYEDVGLVTNEKSDFATAASLYGQTFHRVQIGDKVGQDITLLENCRIRGGGQYESTWLVRNGRLTIHSPSGPHRFIKHPDGSWQSRRQGRPVLLLPYRPDHRETFSRIYQRDEWGGGSGGGSGPGHTVEYREYLARFMRDNNVRSVLDIGCGDWQHSCLIDWTGINYTGVDVVPHVVERNRAAHSAPNVTFMLADGRTVPLDADLLIIKDVVQHWTTEEIIQFLDRMKRSRLRFGLLANCEPSLWLQQGNRDCAAGEWRPVDLLAEPFCLAAENVLEFHTKKAVLWKNPESQS
jgi:SAM-dependent methyltransferase